MSINDSPREEAAQDLLPNQFFHHRGEKLRLARPVRANCQSGSATSEILILKADWICTDSLRRIVRRVVQGAKIRCFDRIAQAGATLATRPIHLLITGVGFRDGDARDFLPRWIGPAKLCPVFPVSTSSAPPRGFFS
jgi:hypothetical protein